MVNGMQMTLDEFIPETYQEQTVGASGSHARISASPESKQGLRETVQACFSDLCTLLDNSKKKKDPNGCSLKMLKICCLLMGDGISPDFSLNWTRAGTMQNGKLSTVKTSYHKTEKGYLLSDIIEDTVDEKYYLSQSQMDKIRIE